VKVVSWSTWVSLYSLHFSWVLWICLHVGFDLKAVFVRKILAFKDIPKGLQYWMLKTLFIMQLYIYLWNEPRESKTWSYYYYFCEQSMVIQLKNLTSCVLNSTFLIPMHSPKGLPYHMSKPWIYYQLWMKLSLSNFTVAHEKLAMEITVYWFISYYF